VWGGGEGGGGGVAGSAGGEIGDGLGRGGKGGGLGGGLGGGGEPGGCGGIGGGAGGAGGDGGCPGEGGGRGGAGGEGGAGGGEGEGGGGEIKLCISSIAFIAKNMAPVVPPAPTNAVTMAPISPNLMGFTTVRTSPTTAPIFDGSAGNVCVAKSGDSEAVPTMAS